jgi:hypothetical protein
MLLVQVRQAGFTILYNKTFKNNFKILIFICNFTEK